MNQKSQFWYFQPNFSYCPYQINIFAQNETNFFIPTIDFFCVFRGKMQIFVLVFENVQIFSGSFAPSKANHLFDHAFNRNQSEMLNLDDFFLHFETLVGNWCFQCFKVVEFDAEVNHQSVYLNGKRKLFLSPAVL